MIQGIPLWTISIGSEKLIKKLLAFTKTKMAFRPWAGGKLPKGYLLQDVVQDAIMIYLKQYLLDITHLVNDKDLEESLQKMIVNRLKVLSELTINRFEMVNSVTIENKYFSGDKTNFDHKAFEGDVFGILIDEPLLWKLFSDLYFNELNRADIMVQDQISAGEYDNLARRLRRKTTPLLKLHNIHRHGKIREKSNSSAGRACPLLV